jgi:hypothetical protein
VIRPWSQALQCADVVAQHELELLVEVGLHFRHPLGSDSLRRDDQCPTHQSAQFELAHDQPGLDGLAETHLVGQQVAHAVTGDGPRQGVDLVRQRNDVGLHGSQQHMALGGAGGAFEHLGHLGCGGHIGNASGLDLRLQVGTQRPQGGAGHAHHRVLVRQPDTAHRLPPQGLFFDDLACAVMNGAILPKRLHPLITFYLDLLPAEL